MRRNPVRLLTWLLSALLAAMTAVVAVPAPASAVPHPPPPPGTVTTMGTYDMRAHYTGNLSTVKGWSVGWTVPQFTNNAWGAVGQWFSGLEGGVYHTDTEGWWVYYYGDDNGLAGNNPECFTSWDIGGHCQGAMQNLVPGQRVTFTYEYCTSTHTFNAAGPFICLYVNMNDGVGNRFLATDLPRAEGPEMYTHDIETFSDSGFIRPITSCSTPIRMLGQRVRINSGSWTNLTGSSFDFVDLDPAYEFRSVNLTASPSTWLTCSPTTNACPDPVWTPIAFYSANSQVYWNQRKYRALTTSTNVRPGTNTIAWQDLGAC